MTYSHKKLARIPSASQTKLKHYFKCFDATGLTYSQVFHKVSVFNCLQLFVHCFRLQEMRNCHVVLAEFAPRRLWQVFAMTLQFSKYFQNFSCWLARIRPYDFFPFALAVCCFTLKQQLPCAFVCNKIYNITEMPYYFINVILDKVQLNLITVKSQDYGCLKFSSLRCCYSNWHNESNITTTYSASSFT